MYKVNVFRLKITFGNSNDVTAREIDSQATVRTVSYETVRFQMKRLISFKTAQNNTYNLYRESGNNLQCLS